MMILLYFTTSLELNLEGSELVYLKIIKLWAGQFVVFICMTSVKATGLFTHYFAIGDGKVPLAEREEPRTRLGFELIAAVFSTVGFYVLFSSHSSADAVSPSFSRKSCMR